MTAGKTIVTGSSGFIGSHLAARLARDGHNGALRAIDVVARAVPCAFSTADITSMAELRAVAPERVETLFHLAAKAEVVIPFEELPDLHSTNVNGTVHVLSAFAPRTMVFASSSAVYGNGARPRVDTRWTNVNPVGGYGITKAAAELACSDWARQTGGAAISFRLGNIIGAGCRGFIPYLVRHAMAYPDGAVPAPIRGEGNVVRDYTPVEYVVELFRRAAQKPWPAGTAAAFNIGTGRGLTNAQVAAMVAEILAGLGYRLRFEPTLPLEPGEAWYVVLDMDETVRVFDAPVPTPEQVRETVAAAVRSALEAARA